MNIHVTWHGYFSDWDDEPRDAQHCFQAERVVGVGKFIRFFDENGHLVASIFPPICGGSIEIYAEAQICSVCNGEGTIEVAAAGAGHSDDLAEYHPCPSCRQLKTLEAAQ